MDSLPIKGSWPTVSRKVKDAYPNLSEDDLKYRKGHTEDLLTRLEIKTGKEREELVSWLSGISRARY